MDKELFSEEYLEDLADPKRDDERYAWKNRHKRMMEEINM